MKKSTARLTLPWKNVEDRDKSSSHHDALTNARAHKMPQHSNSPLRQQETAPSWGAPDKDKFNKLVKEGKIDINNTTPKTIEGIRQRHFLERTRERFRTHYRTQVATLLTGNLRSGGRGLLEPCLLIFLLLWS